MCKLRSKKRHVVAHEEVLKEVLEEVLERLNRMTYLKVDMKFVPLASYFLLGLSP